MPYLSLSFHSRHKELKIKIFVSMTFIMIDPNRRREGQYCNPKKEAQLSGRR